MELALPSFAACWDCVRGLTVRTLESRATKVSSLVVIWPSVCWNKAAKIEARVETMKCTESIGDLHCLFYKSDPL